MEVLYFNYPDQHLLSDAKGDFAKRVLVLTGTEGNNSLLYTFLEKVLGAVGVDLQKDALWVAIDPEQAPVSAIGLFKAKQPAHAIVFGLTPEQLGFNIQVPFYQPFEWQQAVFLWAETLQVLEPDRTKKTQLWQALKLLKF
jgi:hypothetical protein